MKRSSDIKPPRRLVLQWHLTNQCNLRCSHCYQQSFSGEEPDGYDISLVIEQFKQLLDDLSCQAPSGRVSGHINITGGEPFLRPDIMDILAKLNDNRDHFSYGILSNGTLITRKVAKAVVAFSPLFVQVSMEGEPETHDAIRGSNSFNLTVSGLKRLRRRNIASMISFTGHRDNYTEFAAVAKAGRRLGVSRVWADRFIPERNDAASIEKSLTPEQTQAFFRILHKSRRQIWPPLTLTRVQTHRAVQFLENGKKNPYTCSAGSSLMTLMPNGDVYPCRRMPILAGNIHFKSLPHIYESSAIFNALRDPDKTTKGCEGCIHEATCRGGLKCLSYAVNGDPFTADPGCWLATSQTRHLPAS